MFFFKFFSATFVESVSRSTEQVVKNGNVSDCIVRCRVHIRDGTPSGLAVIVVFCSTAREMRASTLK